MSLTSWLRSTTPARSRTDRRPRFRPRLEGLEDRTVPSVTVLKVTSAADSGHNTLRDAILTADQHTNKTYEIDLTVPNPITLKSSLPDLANNITIVGLGTSQTIIQCVTTQAPFRILTVDAGQTAALSGLEITNGNAGSGNGGAIDNFGSLTLTNCLLLSNTADMGGAVANEASATLAVTGTSFTDNHSSDTNADRGGGAIWNSGTLTVWAGSTFSVNTASRDGGAIFNGGTLNALGVSLTGNRADVAGGGIFTEGGVATISGCGFSDNTTGGDGGAIENFATTNVTQTTFTNNHSTATDSEGGGAIGNFGTLTVGANSSFVGNTAAADGGAIFNNGTATVSQTSFGDGTPGGVNSAVFGGAIINFGGATLNANAGTSFNDNTASAYGGAIYNVGGGTLNATGASFANNSAQFGGAILTYGDATFGGTTFTGNKATGNGGSGGGAIWNDGTLTVQSNSSFSGNTADFAGGAIENYGTATVSQTSFGDGTPGGVNSAQIGGAIVNWSGATLNANAGTSFNDNTANADGGAIYNGGGTLVASGASFSNNTAQFGGAILTYGNATFGGTTFTGNKATGNGGSGGGAIWNSGTLTLQSNSRFLGNTAISIGGAIENYGAATVSQTSFGDGTPGGVNSAQYGGAIINWGGATLNANAGSNFNDNSASLYGGAIYNGGTLNATGASFSNNTAQFGGAIYTYGDATFGGTTFTGNKVSGDISSGGGAIWNSGTLTVQSNSRFLGNTASRDGGAIENYGTATVSQTTFGDGTAPGVNSAQIGGAIVNWSGATLNANAGTSFNDNTASLYGGAIYNYLGATLNATGTSFTNNSALDGGAIINYSDATVSGCTFTSNHSTGTGNNYDGGGAIWSEGTLVVKDNSSFSGNTASTYGGAIFNFAFTGYSATVTVSQSAFTNNSAHEGGAIRNGTGTTLTVNAGTTFTGNHADDGAGGAIYNGGTLAATGTTFTNNHAYSGGGILNDRGSANLTGCTFTSNTATVDGGAIYNDFGGMTVSGGQLTFNTAADGGGIVNYGGVLNVVSGCDIASNTATGSGGGIYTTDGGRTNITDSFVAGNHPDDTHTEAGSKLNVDNSSSIVPVQT